VNIHVHKGKIQQGVIYLRSILQLTICHCTAITLLAFPLLHSYFLACSLTNFIFLTLQNLCAHVYVVYCFCERTWRPWDMGLCWCLCLFPCLIQHHCRGKEKTL